MITFSTPPCFTNQIVIPTGDKDTPWEINSDKNRGKLIAQLTDGTKSARFESQQLVFRDKLTEEQIFEFGCWCRNNFEKAAASQLKTQVP